MGRDSNLGTLEGLQVIDLTRVLGGPYCTQILADHGAEVIKVEPPLGDETRGWGPPFDGDTAAYFQGVNRNKYGVVLDLRDPAERQKLLLLLETADVLVENFKPGTLERWGLGYQTVLKERFPRLVHCRISGFGADGPLGGLPGYDAVIQAMSGLMSINGEPEGGPLRAGMPIVDMVTGLNAALGVLMALRERDRSGEGQFVEAALFDCALSVLHPYTANFFASGRTPGRSGNAHPNIAPYDKFRTGTGEIFLAVGNHAQFVILCDVLGLPELAEAERFGDNAARMANRDALRGLLETAFAQWDGTALAEKLSRSGVPCGPVLDIAAALAQPHTAHREMVVEFDGYKGVASPIKFSRTPASYRMLPPKLNEHASRIFTAANTNEKLAAPT